MAALWYEFRGVDDMLLGCLSKAAVLKVVIVAGVVVVVACCGVLELLKVSCLKDESSGMEGDFIIGRQALLSSSNNAVVIVGRQ